MRYIRHTPRQGAAAVEMAFMMPLLLALMLGVWEIGRLVQIQQTMNNAAREGARIASQATIINSSGTYTDISLSGTSPDITDTISQYLQGCGITNVTGLTVTFTYLNGNTSSTQPYQGTQNQQFQLSITLPYANVQWSPLSLVNPSTVGGTCVWQIMVDLPVSVPTTVPSWTPFTS
jgi:Flp pilus assembly protein TadG